jgi:RNA polymerase sigma-70 factor (ECF subfamily)
MDEATGLFSEHAAALERLAARITCDSEDARDLVGDAFLAFLRSGPSDREHAVPWLYLTVRRRAYNRARDRSRARRRLAAMAAEGETVSAPPTATDPSIEALLSNALGSLGERDRTAIVLRHLHERSYEDLALALDTTPAQARVVVHRAGARLRRQLVGALGQRHGVSTSCADSLASTGRHEGCPRCLAVSDEIAALLHRGAAMTLAPSGRRFAGVAGRWWHRAHAVATRRAMAVGDAVTPVAVALAITVGAVVPVEGGPLAPANASVASPIEHVANATAKAPASAPAGSAVANGRPPNATVAAVTRAVAQGATIGPVASVDDPGVSDGSTLAMAQQARELLVLGHPIHLLDPLDVDADAGPELDIRSLEVATLAGDDGAAAALRIRVTFESPLPAELGPVLGWQYPDSDCNTYITWSEPRRGMWTSCPAMEPVYSYRQSTMSGPIEVRWDGPVFEVTITFSRLDAASRYRLRPGGQLIAIRATTSCDLRDTSCRGDEAPDSGSFEYRIPSPAG